MKQFIFCFTAAFKHCQEAHAQGNNFTGVYPIHIENKEFFYAPCDMQTDGGGWIVFQRRVDATVDFYRGWNEYKSGFGNPNGNFWLGLEKIHRLAAPGKGAILRVDLKGISNRNVLKYAEYSGFSISSEADGYRISVSGYTGTAGDSLTYHNNMKFTTMDKDHDLLSKNCAEVYKGAWWHDACYLSHLNALFPDDKVSTATYNMYNSWYYFNSYFGDIVFSEMKIRYPTP